MQSLPSLKKTVEDEGKQGLARGQSSLDLRKIATAVSSSRAETVDITPTEPSSTGGTTIRRRYSAGNLRDHSEEDEGKIPSEEDEHVTLKPLALPSQATEIAAKSGVSSADARRGSVVPTYAEARQNWAERCYQIERNKRIEEERKVVDEGESSTRTEWFLLIENLTKNMIRPCVLDLKMGTRQYGVHSSPEKRASQRKKYKSPTSRLFFCGGVLMIGAHGRQVANWASGFAGCRFGMPRIRSTSFRTSTLDGI